MSNTTAWIGGGLNSGSTAFQAAFNSSDLASLPAGYSVLSSVAAFDNTSTGDQFMDISYVGAFASASTVPQGAGLAFFLYCLEGDGTTYGDGRLTAGTNANYSPLLNPIGGFSVVAGNSISNLIGSVHGIVIPPRKFALVVQNLTTLALTSSTQNCYISTYKQNTNA